MSDSLQPNGHQAPPSVGFSRQEYWSGLQYLNIHIIKVSMDRWIKTMQYIYGREYYWARKQDAVMTFAATEMDLEMILRSDALHSEKDKHPIMWLMCCAKLLQSCPTLCNSMDCSPPGSSVYGTLQARILDWVAISSSRGSSWLRDWTHVCYIICIGRRVLYHWCHLGSLIVTDRWKLKLYRNEAHFLNRKTLTDLGNKLILTKGERRKPRVHQEDGIETYPQIYLYIMNNRQGPAMYQRGLHAAQ